MSSYEPYNQNPPKDKKYLIKYSSNNSGGSWWLKDEDWYNLEKNGWKVWWQKDDPENEKWGNTDGRWLGALAKNAEKEFDSIKGALDEFEKITGQSVTDEGCNCCGRPHDFSWIDKEGKHDYMTGIDLISEYSDDKDEMLKRLLKNV